MAIKIGGKYEEGNTIRVQKNATISSGMISSRPQGKITKAKEIIVTGATRRELFHVDRFMVRVARRSRRGTGRFSLTVSFREWLTSHRQLNFSAFNLLQPPLFIFSHSPSPLESKRWSINRELFDIYSVLSGYFLCFFFFFFFFFSFFLLRFRRRLKRGKVGKVFLSLYYIEIVILFFVI